MLVKSDDVTLLQGLGGLIQLRSTLTRLHVDSWQKLDDGGVVFPLPGPSSGR